MNEVFTQVAPFKNDGSIFILIAALSALILVVAMYKGFREWIRLIDEANADDGAPAPRKGKGKARDRANRRADQEVDREVGRREALASPSPPAPTEQGQDAIDDALVEAQ